MATKNKMDGGFAAVAAVDHGGHQYDDELMSALVQFRDAYLAKNPEGSKTIDWYYKNSPKLMRELETNPNRKQIYEKMYKEFLRPAYEAIKQGKIEQAHKILQKMISFAKELIGDTTNMASGGLSDLGSYSDGGRLLRGPGDGVSDSIPATIGHKQPARLADGEFVVPARIVSEIGNGSTEAGARKLYAMMDRVQNARSKTMGKGKVAKNTRAEKYLPA